MSGTDAPPLPGGPAARWVGLDALRGLSIAAMILVNNPGDWGHVYAPLQHARWHGCTPTDLVFPTFLFVAGVAIVPALQRARSQGHAPSMLLPRILRRVVALLLFGWLLSAFPLVTFAEAKPLFDPLLSLRVPGVLQRIGVCYGLAALLFLFTSPATQRRVLLGCLFGYWLLITMVPVPGVGMPNLDEPMGTLQGYVDRAVFGDHIYKVGQYDPEGLLSTIPALATALFGVMVGRVLYRTHDPNTKVATLLRLGALWMLGGVVWSWWLPLNKPLWTSSYAVWTAGIATTGLGLCVWAFEQRRWTRVARPLQVYGVNALLVFVGSGLLGRVVGRLLTVTVDGKEMSLQQVVFGQALLPAIGDPKLASLAFAVLWILGWYVVLALLYRRGLVWKV